MRFCFLFFFLGVFTPLIYSSNEVESRLNGKYLLPPAIINFDIHHHACLYSVGSISTKSHLIIFVNGMLNTFEDAKQSLTNLSEHFNDIELFGVYNPTHKVFGDAAEAILNGFGIETNSVGILLKNKITSHIATYGNDSKVLIICHSQGVMQTKIALKKYLYPYKHYLKVLAIAPPITITNRYCSEVLNITNGHDPIIISNMFFTGFRQNGKDFFNENVEQSDTSDAPYPDHSIQSKIYTKDALLIIRQFLKN